MRSKFIKLAKNLTSIAVQNSEVIQPYVEPKYYRRGLAALNALHWALRLADK